VYVGAPYAFNKTNLTYQKKETCNFLCSIQFHTFSEAARGKESIKSKFRFRHVSQQKENVFVMNMRASNKS
jgi:hypothetical protein